MGRPKGSHHPLEVRLKISLSMRGHLVSEATRKKISEANRRHVVRARVRRLKDALRQGKYNWSEKGRAARSRYNRTPRGRAALLAAKARYRARMRLMPKPTALTREAELAKLIAEQARDARTFNVKYGPPLLAREDEAYATERES